MSDSLNIGFIGLGLIGGSIAKSLKRFHPQTRIFAYTRTEATLDLAVSERIVDVKMHERRRGICFLQLYFPLRTGS